MVTQMNTGGAQTALLRLADGLRRRGHAVETWFLYQKRPTFVHVEGVRVILPKPPRHPGHSIGLLWRLTRRLRRDKPDVVITFLNYANILGQLAAKLAGVPRRIASHRNPATSYPRAVRWADRLVGAWGLYSANVMVSGSVADSFAHYPNAYRRRVSVITNGIDFRPSSLSVEDARRKFQLPPAVPLVVTVGRLAEQKNQTVLLHALAGLPSVHLAIAGGGELKDELTAQTNELKIRDRVHFLGEVLPPDIPDLLRTGDIFALPSKFEGLSNALLEALGAGLPIIASDIPAQADVLLPPSGEPVGLLLPPDDVAAWRQAIGRLAGDAAARQAMQAKSLSRVLDFTTARMIGDFERLCFDPSAATTDTRGDSSS